MNNDIELFIRNKVQPQHIPLVQRFRELIKANFSEVKEEMRGGNEKYYGVPVYRLNRIIVTISPTKKGITYSFSDGKAMEDKYRLLEGVGNKSLNIRLGSINEFNDEQMLYYLRQAVEIDRKR